jgi:hypothetical protein
VGHRRRGEAGFGGSAGTTLVGVGGTVDTGGSSSTPAIVTLSSGLSNPVSIVVDATHGMGTTEAAPLPSPADIPLVFATQDHGAGTISTRHS